MVSGSTSTQRPLRVIPIPTTSYRSRSSARAPRPRSGRRRRARCWCRRRPPPPWRPLTRKAGWLSLTIQTLPRWRPASGRTEDWGCDQAATPTQSRAIHRAASRDGRRDRRSAGARGRRAAEPTGGLRLDLRRCPRRAGAELGYGRYGNPTWPALEEAIGALEGGRALTFSSGMAAAYAVLELLPPGAVVVIPDNCYLGVATLSTGGPPSSADRATGQRRRHGRGVEAAEGADLVWLESPANPTIEVADLPAIGRKLSGQALFVVDNTFATPLLQRPLESGADIVLHSATKLISGHSDVLLGALVTRIDKRALRRAGSDPPFGRRGPGPDGGLSRAAWAAYAAAPAGAGPTHRTDSGRAVGDPSLRSPGTVPRAGFGSRSRCRSAHHVGLWLADLHRACGRQDRGRIHRCVLAVGLCHQPRRG